MSSLNKLSGGHSQKRLKLRPFLAMATTAHSSSSDKREIKIRK